MRLRFLGTGAAGGTPGRGRSRRLESSLLVQAEGRVLIDVTSHLERQARALDGPDAVLLTHAHEDASGGLPALARRREAQEPLPVYASPGTIATLRRRVARLEGCRFVAVEPGRWRRVAGITVTPVTVPHARDERYPTYAWRLSAKGVRMVYASDVSELTPDLRRHAAGAALLVVDGAMWGRRIFSHLTIEQALPELCPWRVERILLTQIGRTAPPHERLEREAAALCERAAPAHDGMELALR